MDASSAQLLLSQIHSMDTVFGLFYEVPTGYFKDAVVDEASNSSVLNPSDVPADIITLIEQRIELKANKDYKTADEIRDQLRSKGYDVKDGKNGAYEIFSI